MTTKSNTDLAQKMPMLMLSADKLGVRKMDQMLNDRWGGYQGTLSPYLQTGFSDHKQMYAVEEQRKI